MSAKPIFFISDLHLGSGAANDFHRTYELHRFLDYAAENASELILLGDVLELLQSDFASIYATHHGIFKHLFRVAEIIPTTYVMGNHDAAVALECDETGRGTFLGSHITVTPTYTNAALRTYAVHGHGFDAVNRHSDPLDPSSAPSAGDRIATAVGFLERHVDSRIDTLLENAYLQSLALIRRVSHGAQKFIGRVTPAHPDYVRLGGDYSEYLRGAKGILKSDAWDVCVMGHTHGELIHCFTHGHDGCEGVYVNTGSWVGESSPPIFASIDAGTISLVDASTFAVVDRTPRLAKSLLRQMVPHRASSRG